MPRRKPDPREEWAKGYPGRRKSKTDREIERMEREAKRDAKLFADNSFGGNLQAIPIFLEDKRLAAAQAVLERIRAAADRAAAD